MKKHLKKSTGRNTIADARAQGHRPRASTTYCSCKNHLESILIMLPTHNLTYSLMVPTSRHAPLSEQYARRLSTWSGIHEHLE